MANDNYLVHHGVPDQKWGRRRFQNPDGTYTLLGKLRRRVGYDDNEGSKRLTRKERRELKRKRNEQIEKEREKKRPLREKKISSMNDDELSKYIARMSNERTALQLRAEVAKLDPKPVSFGQQFVNKVLKDTVQPALLNVGKQYLEKAMKDALKMNEKQAETKEQKAKRENDYWKNLSNIESSKAAYNQTKALNEKYDKTQDVSVYKKNK